MACALAALTSAADHEHSHRDHPAVREYVHRLAGCGADRALRRAYHRLLRHELARTAPARTPARPRIPTNAVWDTVVFALNIFAFVFVGLQFPPISACAGPSRGERTIALSLPQCSSLSSHSHRLATSFDSRAALMFGFPPSSATPDAEPSVNLDSSFPGQVCAAS